MADQTPTFTWCGKYSGKEKSGALWLKAYEVDLRGLRGPDGKVPPATYIEYFELLLEGDAAEWAESNLEANRLFNASSPTEATVEQLKSLFKQRFPAKIIESVPVTFDRELSELRQKQNESITDYFTRTRHLMQKYGAKDRVSGELLTLGDGSLLDTFLHAWLRGLVDNSVKMECARCMRAADRSLRMLYDAADSAHETNLERQRLIEEESNHNELQFLRELTRRNMPETQINALHPSYQTKAHGHDHPWGYHEHKATPPYRSGTAPPFMPPAAPPPQRPLTSNPNRANQGPSLLQERRPRSYQQSTPKSVPSRKDSSNPWVNGTRIYDAKRDGRLCVKCGTLGHIPKDCAEEYLASWEQTILKELVFGPAPPLASSAAIGCGGFYDPPSPRGSLPQGSQYQPQSSRDSFLAYTPSTSNQTQPTSPRTFLASPASNSVHFGTAGLMEAIESKSAEAMLGEGSGPNKRPHVEDTPQAQPQAQQAPNNSQGPPFQPGLVC